MFPGLSPQLRLEFRRLKKNYASYEKHCVVQKMSYARARLWLGISCVGTIVVITSVLLAFEIPTELLTTNAIASWSDVSGLLAVVLVYAFISGPFDFFGGYILPKEYKKRVAGFRFFLGAWFKGAFIHGVMLIAVGLILINSARVSGFWFAFCAFVLLNILLFAAALLHKSE